MKFSYSWLRELVSVKVAPAKIAELLTFHTAEVEHIERRGGDTVLDLDILPNRSHDLTSHLGVAREIAALTGMVLRPPHSADLTEGKRRTPEGLSVTVGDAKACPRYIGRLVEGVRVGSSPRWLRERLEAVGMRSVNNVVDATNYVMLEYGQPLHAFDADLVKNAGSRGASARRPKAIFVRRAKKGERLVTLDGEKLAFGGWELVIADLTGPLALAGVKGGRRAAISPKTRNLILEAANFDPVLVRRASRILGVESDSAKHFAAGLHPALAERAMTRLAALIVQLAGGTVWKGALDCYPDPQPPSTILFDIAACRELLGTAVGESQALGVLRKLGMTVKRGRKSGSFIVVPPLERLDLAIPEDLYEEVGRVLGWDAVAASPPRGLLAPARPDPVFSLADRTRRILAGFGFSEHVGYSFVPDALVALLRKAGFSLVELENPAGPDTRYLRPTLLASLGRALGVNARRRDALRMFEIGKVFSRTSEGVRERWSLGVAVFLKKIRRPHEAWFELKGVVDGFSSALALQGPVWREHLESEVLGTEGASLLIGEELMGRSWQLGPGILERLGVVGSVAFAQIDLETILAQEAGEREFSEIPRYPSVTRDLAVLVPRGTKVESVENVIEREGGELLWDADLFDVYEDEALGGKESLAFRLVFQHRDRTLREGEVAALVAKIVRSLEQAGWEIRG